MRKKLRVLDRKLLRDLWRLKGQIVAVMLVVASGAALLVMSTGMIASLGETRAAYYERARFAEVFAPAVRAPRQMLPSLRALPGVARVEARIAARARIDLPGMTPLTGQLVSIDPLAEARLNDVVLLEGRMIAPGRPDEALLLQPFAEAHGYRPGDRLTVVADGQEQRFTITGLAQSPEFIYALPPGEIVSDPSRYVVLWTSEEALEAAFDLDGAFNEALFTLSRGASSPAVLGEIDRLLAPYGGTGAYGREDQLSHRYLHEELASLRTMGRIMTPIFLGVAAFLLSIVIGRLVEVEREQIGLLKAFGRTNAEVGAHYFKLALAVAVSGGILGWLGGLWLGREMSLLYQNYFSFPFLIFETPFRSLVPAVGVGLGSAALGALMAVRKAAALPPAVAMRPPVPPRYGGRGGRGLLRLVDQPTRMIMRRLAHQPLRAVLTAAGIGAAMGLTLMMQLNQSAIGEMIERSFRIADRSDVTVTFTRAAGPDAALSLERLEGVGLVEPTRGVPVLFRHGTEEKLGTLTGLGDAPVLVRAMGEDMRPVTVSGDGIVLSRALAEILDVVPGERLTVEVREGRRPVLELPVTGLTDSLIGTPAYMSMEALGRALGEPGWITGAVLSADEAEIPAIIEALTDAPLVAGVSLRAEAEAEMVRMTREGPGFFRRVMTVISAIIATGVVYNSARISFMERQHDIASLMVLGYTRAEAGYVLLGELVAIVLLALPIGALFGVGLWVFVASALSTELYQIPTVLTPEGFGTATLIILLSALAAGLLVYRDTGKIELASALKVRE